MKAIYRIATDRAPKIEVAQGINPMLCLGKDVVKWEIGANNCVSVVILELNGLQVIQDRHGTIQSSDPALVERAFELATSIANVMLVQTGCTFFDPSEVLVGSPEIEPENDFERTAFAQNNRTSSRSITGCACIAHRFDPANYSSLLTHSNALASYADGIRTQNPISKYEQFYKVIEHSFTEKNTKNDLALDRAVSAHVSKFNAKFDIATVGKIRGIRNRCVHPQKPGHINPENLSALEELKSALPLMKELALLLIQHPPP